MNLCPAVLSVALLMLDACKDREQGTPPARAERGATLQDFSKEIGIADDKGEKPVAVIFDVYSDRLFSGVRLAIWSDGRILWPRTSQADSGTSYCSSRIHPEQLQRALRQLSREGVFGSSGTSEDQIILDSSYRQMVISTGTLQLSLRSIHEFYEDSPNLVVTAYGLESLNGRIKAGLMAQQPSYYKRFLALWKKTKTALVELIPDRCEQLATVKEIDDPKQGCYVSVEWGP